MLQTALEQFLLLGTEVATGICVRIASIIRVRVPENAPYACRVVQHLTRMLRRTIAADVQPIRDALEPLKRGLLSHALSNMFRAVNEAFEDPTVPTTVIEKVTSNNPHFHVTTAFPHYHTIIRGICCPTEIGTGGG